LKNKSLPSRRTFSKIAIVSATSLTLSGTLLPASKQVRLGGPVFGKFDSPEEWTSAHQALGYTAAYCKLQPSASDVEVEAYKNAAKHAGLIIAEVGAWSNPISPNENEQKKALEKNINSLDLADRIGANCCVNISGSRNPDEWAGPHKDNLATDTFDLIVETTRKIIDAVKPRHTFYTLETMPWAYPDSPQSYLALLKAIDRKQFAAHLDPVNLVNSPQRYYKSGELIKECFKLFGAYIKSCHAKDIGLSTKLTTHLDEVQPGTGGLDYNVFLNELARLDNIPLMLEHLKTPEEYKQAANFIKQKAKENNLSI
jgi:sugar phosphate isomerase/epimerase